MIKRKEERLKKDMFFKEMRRQFRGLSFDDVLLVPNESDVVPSEVNLKTKFSRTVALKCPFVSSPMDTVTESDMAIEMALLGGIGIIHRALNSKDQAYQVARTKYHLNRLIDNPICVKSADTVETVLKLIKEKKYKFRSFPVLDENGNFVGLLTGNDFDFCLDKKILVGEVMSTDLMTAKEGTTMRQAFEIMRENRKKILPLISPDKKLKGIYIFSDVKRIVTRSAEQYNLDSDGRLKVGAAVGVMDDAFERAALLERKGVDVIVIDVAHGHTPKMVKTVKELKKMYPNIDVVAGNIVTAEAAKKLVDAGADGVKVGIGPGSICTTRVISGNGRAQLTAVYEVSRAIRGSRIPVCADGGLKFSGDIVKALAAGADSVMFGGLFAGTKEAPGEIKMIGDLPYKVYRGMGSLGAMQDNEASRQRYGQIESKKEKLVPEGVESVIPYKGELYPIVFQLLGGLRSGMGYSGASNIEELHKKAIFEDITESGQKESHPHSLAMVKDAPNYKINKC